VLAIFQAHTAFVEPLSLDEAYLDVTATVRDLEEAAQLAREIKQQIRSTTDLTASAGVSYCKFLAKLASDAHKPNGLTVISPEQTPAFLEVLSIDKFVGVGKVTATKLKEVGIEHGIDLKRLGEELLYNMLRLRSVRKCTGSSMMPEPHAGKRNRHVVDSPARLAPREQTPPSACCIICVKTKPHQATHTEASWSSAFLSLLSWYCS
jgi:hypothetical protein